MEPSNPGKTKKKKTSPPAQTKGTHIFFPSDIEKKPIKISLFSFKHL